MTVRQSDDENFIRKYDDTELGRYCLALSLAFTIAFSTSFWVGINCFALFITPIAAFLASFAVKASGSSISPGYAPGSIGPGIAVVGAVGSLVSSTFVVEFVPEISALRKATDTTFAAVWCLGSDTRLSEKILGGEAIE
jgi:hypothetical protein